MEIEQTDSQTIIRIDDLIETDDDLILMGWCIKYLIQAFMDAYPEKEVNIRQLVEMTLHDRRELN